LTEAHRIDLPPDQYLAEILDETETYHENPIEDTTYDTIGNLSKKLTDGENIGRINSTG
jgi:hypothetical protein